MQDKGHKMVHPQEDLMGMKPFGSIGENRSQMKTKIVSKLKDKIRAKGSTSMSGKVANVGGVSGAIKNFVNR